MRYTAVIVGGSSGIGEALARELHREGWRLGLAARRLDRLEALRASLHGTVVRRLDVSAPDAAATIDDLFSELGDVDLVVICAGTGHLNPQLDDRLEADTVAVNVAGFVSVADSAMKYFLARGKGHLVGISSIAGRRRPLRGNHEAAAYAASKAFQSVYLDGLRELAKVRRLPIAVTDVPPGFVRTAMMKTSRPLPWLVRRFLVSSPETAARQISRAIRRRAKHAYITRRYTLVAWFVRCLPRPG
jgi:short-subunit dehydrogenase